MPNRALSDRDLYKYVRLLGIQNFRGIFTVDDLPASPRDIEKGIINLDCRTCPGTHWVAYSLFTSGQEKIVWYMDPLGNLSPPIQFMQYMKNINKIYYNRWRYQPVNSVICGHLALKFLYSV